VEKKYALLYVVVFHTGNFFWHVFVLFHFIESHRLLY